MRWGCVTCGTEYQLRIFTCPRCRGTEIIHTGMVPIPLSEVAAAQPAGRAPVVAAKATKGKAENA